MNIRHLFDRNKESLLLFGALALFFVAIAVSLAGVFRAIDVRGESPRYVWLVFHFIVIICCLLLVAFLQQRSITGIRRTQYWLIDATNWNIERIKAHGLCRLPDDTAHGGGDAGVGRWPWGAHHTELLGHLDAAARKFWTLYDPDDPSTAPTNDMVSDWLQRERHVSKEKAKAIASILRPDGLPTGPRR